MRVAISIGGRFHLFNLAQQLLKRNALSQLITSYPKFEVAKYGIPKSLVSSVMRKEILERDKYTCQLCNQRGGYLQVDHIQKWSKYSIIRFSMDNCRTLCMSCHYLVTYNKSMPKNIKTWGHNFKQLERSVI